MDSAPRSTPSRYVGKHRSGPRRSPQARMPVMTTVVVLSGGPDRPAVDTVPPGATVIAADGGAEVARHLGLEVDLVVGDLDSISAATLAGIAQVERHAAEKDATDLELALTAALRLEPERILVLAGAGGRLDH